MTVDAIKAAIEQLQEADRLTLANWLEEQSQEAWELEIERDFSASGRGHQILEKVKQQIDQGEFTPMDWEVPGPQRH